ncbi:MAG: hypothetical protein ABIS86_24170 [Streptosporangiaceae bacterium]
MSLILLNTGAADGASPELSPGSGSVLTSSTVTVRAKAPAGGGTLTVDGLTRATGDDEWLTYTIDGHATRNSAHSASLDAGDPADSDSTSFWMSVPAAAPRGVSVSASGRTITTSWTANDEPDILGYTVRSSYASKAAGVCSGTCSTSFKVPADAVGTLAVSVVAERAGGAGLSAPGNGSVELLAPVVPSPSTSRPSNTKTPSTTHTGPSAGSSPTPTPTTTSPSPFFPTNGAPPTIPAWLNPSSAPSSAAPAPGESDLFPSVAPAPSPDPSGARLINAGNSSSLAAFDQDRWTRALAIVLAALVCAAHLGTWRHRRRRIWLAKALAAAGVGGVVPGSAHARVRAERGRIEAAAVSAQAGTSQKGLSRRGRRLKRRADRKAAGQAGQAGQKVSLIHPGRGQAVVAAVPATTETISSDR